MEMNVSEFFDERGIYAQDEQIVLQRPNERDKNDFYRIFLEDELFARISKMMDITQTADEELSKKNKLVCFIYGKDSGTLYGYCGIDNITLELPEIEIKLFKEAQNNGFGTRALRLLMNTFSEKTGVTVFRSRVASDNYICQRVMDKLGAAFAGLSSIIGETSEYGKSFIEKLEKKFPEEADEKLFAAAEKYNVDPKKLFSHNLEFRLTVSPVSPERRLEKMTEKDIDRFKEIYISAFSVSEEHQKVYDFEKYLQPFIYDKDKHAFMLYSGETAVGVVLAIEKPSLSAEPSVYIELCAVDALYQRRGNGTAMLNMFFEKFHENAFITLETYKSRPAYDWYQKMGFVDDDEIRYLVHNPALSLIWNDLQMLRKRNSELTEIKNKLENEDAQNS